MVDRRIFGLSCVCLASCGVDPEVLALTTICRSASDACYVRFDATLTSGLAPDMVAAHLGDNGGELHIQLSRIPNAGNSQWSLDVLAASTATSSVMVRTLTWGSCGAGCPTDPVNVDVTLEEDFNWAQVVIDAEGAVQIGRTALPQDAEIILSGADIDIVAIRTPGFDIDYYY